MIIELAKHFLFYVKKKPTTHVEFVTWGGDKRNPCGSHYLSLLRCATLLSILPPSPHGLHFPLPHAQNEQGVMGVFFI